MRERLDSDGNICGYHNMVFDNIPDDYKLKKVILNDKVPDLSYLGVMKHLREIEAGEEFSDDVFYSSEVLYHMAMDYLQSALLLRKGIAMDRGQDVVSYYLIPCAFLCKHSIELILKRCLLSQGERKLNGHNILGLWDRLKNKDMPHYGELREFILEVEKIDNNEMALRYGISKDLAPLQERFKFDIDNLLTNTMFLFNVVQEYNM